MSGGKIRYFLTLILLLPIAAACTPVGAVFDYDDSFSADEMWVIPRRHEYKAGEYFRPGDDLYVYVSNQGAVAPLPVSRVSIGIITNPDAAIRDAPIPVPTSGAQLVSAMGVGRKLVTVQYPGFDPATYSIEVRDVIGSGGDGTGDGSGFVVIWK
jgi:hypothetical protein